jgi:hypothetical protein
MIGLNKIEMNNSFDWVNLTEDSGKRVFIY